MTKSGFTTRQMTVEEYKQGFCICACGKYAFVFRNSIVNQLVDGYSGELCPECMMWMCSIDKLKEAGVIQEMKSEDNSIDPGI